MGGRKYIIISFEKDYELLYLEEGSFMLVVLNDSMYTLVVNL